MLSTVVILILNVRELRQGSRSLPAQNGILVLVRCLCSVPVLPWSTFTSCIFVMHHGEGLFSPPALELCHLVSKRLGSGLLVLRTLKQSMASC